MAIEGLLVKQPEQPERLYLPGTPDIAEAVGVTMKAYQEIGRIAGYGMDPEKAAETVEKAFREIIEYNYDGRLFIRPPREISFDTLIAAADGKRPDSVVEAYRWRKLWIPSTAPESYTDKQLDKAPKSPRARLALFNSNPDTGVDPLLHHLDIPADDYARNEWDGDTTQVAEVKKDKKAFEGRHPGYNLDELDPRDFAMLALMDRIRGVKPKDIVLNQGSMRILKLGRRTVGGDSCVGVVFSEGGRLGLDGSSGDASPCCGVGVSMGQEEMGPRPQ